jgi:L-fucose isomerase-like protein
MRKILNGLMGYNLVVAWLVGISSIVLTLYFWFETETFMYVYLISGLLSFSFFYSISYIIKFLIKLGDKNELFNDNEDTKVVDNETKNDSEIELKGTGKKYEKYTNREKKIYSDYNDYPIEKLKKMVKNSSEWMPDVINVVSDIIVEKQTSHNN